MALAKLQSKRTIVVVDDDGATRDSFAALLTSAGYQVETFATGLHFLESIPAVQAQCALLDVQMPYQDGLSVLAQFVAIGSDIPIILMTSQPKSISHEEARSHGALMVLEKPIEEACLLSAIEKAINGNG